MNTEQSNQAGQSSVPLCDLQTVLDQLAHIAGQLEAVACTIAEHRQPPTCVIQQAAVVGHIEALLTGSIERGTKAFPALTLAEWLCDNMAIDGIHVSVNTVRRMLPPIMSRLFGSKLSCSVKDKDGRVVRGYRGLALRDVPEATPAQP